MFANAQSLHLCMYVCFFFFEQVRGYKIFMQLLPHEVADLPPVLDLLFQQDSKDNEVRLWCFDIHNFLPFCCTSPCCYNTY